MRLIFKFIWLDMVRFWWTLVYALSTGPGQLTPKTPTQCKLYARAMGATLNVQLLLEANSKEST